VTGQVDTARAQDRVGNIVARDEPTVISGVEKQRNLLGWSFLALGLLAILVALYLAWVGIEHVKFDVANEVPQSIERLAYAHLAVHAIVTIALVYLGYSLVRAAERMFVPRWLLQATDERDVEVIKAILGVDSPGKAIVKLTKSTLEAIGEVIGPIVGAVRGEKKKE
jgi:hypothetical protein